MAGFKTHISTSGVLGVGYASAAYLAFDLPLPTCVLAGGLCGVSGMLPDLDSDSGIPIRESMGFAAAVVPMLMIDRFQHLGLSNESMVLAGGLIYLLIRFGVSRLLKKFTVHRGMWHSLPAAAIAGLLAFLICSCEDPILRLYKSGGVVLGYLSHLVLDEIYSLDFRGGRIRLKKSFGTALKITGKNTWANLSTYGKLAALVVLAIGDPVTMNQYDLHSDHVHHIAQDVLEKLQK